MTYGTTTGKFSFFSEPAERKLQHWEGLGSSWVSLGASLEGLRASWEGPGASWEGLKPGGRPLGGYGNENKSQKHNTVSGSLCLSSFIKIESQLV